MDRLRVTVDLVEYNDLHDRMREAEGLLREWLKEYDCGSFCDGDCSRARLHNRTFDLLSTQTSGRVPVSGIQ